MDTHFPFLFSFFKKEERFNVFVLFSFSRRCISPTGNTFRCVLFIFPITNGNTLAVSVSFLHLHTKTHSAVFSSVTKIIRKHIPLCFSSVSKHRLQRTNFSSLLGKFLFLKFNCKQTLPLNFFIFLLRNDKCAKH